MAKKKRQSIDQLREAGKIATEMLRDRHIIADKSVIDQILQDSKAPTLPGIPAYLPHEWTIKAAQRVMRDIVIMWKEEFKDNPSARQKDDITEFWKFVVMKMRELETDFNREIVAIPAQVRKMEKQVGEVPLLKDVFGPWRKKENERAILHFLVDSFAIAVVVKQNHSVGEYLEWFLEWTQDLHLLWIKPQKRKDFKRV